MATVSDIVALNVETIGIIIIIDYLPTNIPNVLTTPPSMKAVLFEANEKMAKAPREDTSLNMPIITAARRGSKLIPALSRNGAV